MSQSSSSSSLLERGIDGGSALGRALVSLMAGNANAYYLRLDLIQDRVLRGSWRELQPSHIEPNEGRELDWFYYGTPFLIMAFHAVDNYLVFSRAGFKYGQYELRDWLSRKIYPIKMWRQSDFVFVLGSTIELSVFTLLLWKPAIAPQWRIYAVRLTASGSARGSHGLAGLAQQTTGATTRLYSNGKVWEQQYTDKILRFRRLAHPLLLASIVSGYVQTICYWGYNLHVNSTGSFRDYCLMAHMPLFALYGDFGVVFISFYMMLMLHYTRLKQSVMLGDLRALTRSIVPGSGEGPVNGTVRTVRNRLKQAVALSTEQVWRRWEHLNRQVMQLQAEIRAYSAYWCPFFSAYYAVHITLDTILLYGFLAYDTEPDVGLFEKSFFIFFTLQCGALLILLTLECAFIVSGNAAIYRANREFCYRFTAARRTHTRPSAEQLLKLDQIVAYHHASKLGFKLMNNYTIDSKMFEMIFVYMSCIFMKVLEP